MPGNAPHAELLERMAAIAGAAAGSQYGPINGDAPLRQAYAAELSRIYEGRIEPEDIAVTAGCNMAFFAAMMLLAHRGDAVLLPTPWYFNHQMSLDMLGIEPRPLPCRAEAGFVPRVEDAEALIDEQGAGHRPRDAQQPDRRRLSGACDRELRAALRASAAFIS